VGSGTQAADRPAQRHLTLAAAPLRTAGAVQGIVLLVPSIMGVMGVLVLSPVVPRMVAQFHDVPNTTFWVTTLLTIPGLCLILFSPLAGLAGDKFGRRKLLIAATGFYAAFGMAPLLLDNLWTILATRIGVGIAEAFVLTLSTTLIGDFFVGPARDRWLGLQMAVASVGAIACLLLGGLLGSMFGWRGPFALYGIAAIMGLAITLLTWEPGTGDQQEAPVGWAGFPWARILGISGLTIFASILIFTWQIQVGLALTALGIADPGRIGMMTALASLGVCAGTLVFQAVTRIPVARLLSVEFLLLGATYAALGIVRDPTTFLAISALNQLAAGMLMPTLLTWAVRQLSFDIRGRGLGIWQGSFAIGTFFAGALIPPAIAISGGVLQSYSLLGAAGISAGVVATGVALFLGLSGRTPSASGKAVRT
jgi:predicted MFS family arabinose efflux permease